MMVMSRNFSLLSFSVSRVNCIRFMIYAVKSVESYERFHLIHRLLTTSPETNDLQ